jgi:hypothetical protein
VRVLERLRVDAVHEDELVALGLLNETEKREERGRG